MKKRNIIVVGTGFAAAAAVYILLKKKIKPTIVDANSNNFNLVNKDKNKLPLGIKKNYTFSPLIDFEKNDTELLASESFGGLSRVWGGAINKLHFNESKKWPISLKILEKYYKIVDNFFLHCGNEDNYSKEFNLKKPDLKIKNNLKNYFVQNNDKRILIGNSRLAVNKNNKIFSLNSYFLKLIKQKKIEIIKNFEVLTIQEKKDKIIISSKNNTLYCNKLFIACGPMSAAKIILNSFESIKNVKLKESSLVSSLWFSTKSINIYHSNLLCDYFLTKFTKPYFSSQIYIFKDKIIDKIFNKKNIIYNLLKKFPNSLKSRFLIFLTYIDDKNSHNITIYRNNKKFKILLKKKDLSAYYLIKKMINVFLKKKLFHIFDIKKNFGYGYHFGSSFPMSNKKSLKTSDNLGRILNQKNIHFIDASVLPSIPISSITYTVMANASRIVDLSLNKK
ncbi:GMC family oxidoreductase [Candidatus Pelagibacter sp.]|nr:GMC family oxidoreductase [Candidatus Pelagibacter sp.]